MVDSPSQYENPAKSILSRLFCTTKVVSSPQSGRKIKPTTPNVFKQTIQNLKNLISLNGDKSELLRSPWVKGALCTISIVLSVFACINLALLTYEFLNYLFLQINVAAIVNGKYFTLRLGSGRSGTSWIKFLALTKHIKYFLFRYSINGAMLGISYFINQYSFNKSPHLAKPFLIACIVPPSLTIFFLVSLEQAFRFLSGQRIRMQSGPIASSLTRFLMVFLPFLYWISLAVVLFGLCQLVRKYLIQPLGQGSVRVFTKKSMAYLARITQQHRLIFNVISAMILMSLIVFNPPLEYHAHALGEEQPSTQWSYHNALVFSFVRNNIRPGEAPLVSIGCLGKVYAYREVLRRW